MPFWGTLNIRRRIIIGIQKGTMILTTTHMGIIEKKWKLSFYGLGLHWGAQGCMEVYRLGIRLRKHSGYNYIRVWSPLKLSFWMMPCSVVYLPMSNVSS